MVEMVSWGRIINTAKYLSLFSQHVHIMTWCGYLVKTRKMINSWNSEVGLTGEKRTKINETTFLNTSVCVCVCVVYLSVCLWLLFMLLCAWALHVYRHNYDSTVHELLWRCVFSEIHPVRSRTSRSSPYKTKHKPGLFTVLMALCFFCCQSSLG